MPCLLTGLVRHVWIAVIAVVVASAGVHARDSTRTPQQNSRVIGGAIAPPGSWPFAVALFKSAPASRPFCGGSRIDARWVLTAAHCVDTLAASDVLVFVGSTDLSNGGEMLAVDEVIVHGDFEKDTYENDIALLRLAGSPAPFATDVVGIMGQAGLVSAGHEVKAAGWGLLREIRQQNGVYFDAQTGDELRPDEIDDARYRSTRLVEVRLPLVGEDRCRSAYPDEVIDGRNLCAGLEAGGKDTCQGDSGGPLVTDGAGGVLLGIVSWGHGCARPGKFGVYTRVSAFTEWLRQQTGLALASPVADAPPTAPQMPVLEQPSVEVEVSSTGDRALLVGIDTYKDPKLNLIGSANDVANMHGLLTGALGYRPDQIMTLVDAQATRKNILDAMDAWLVDGSRAGGRIFFYYSGHGGPARDIDGDEADGYDEALAPYDVIAAAGEFRNLIIDDEINSRLNRMRDREVTVVLDSCFSGTATRSPELGSQAGTVRSLLAAVGRGDPRALSTRSAGDLNGSGFLERSDNVTAWSAVNNVQYALVDTTAPQPQGVFTRRFVEGLSRRRADENGDGEVSHGELLRYVRAASAAYCESWPEQCSLGLDPQLETRTAAFAASVVTGALPESPVAVIDSAVGEIVGDLEIALEPASPLRLGQSMNIRVSSGVAGHLLVFDVNANGEITQLFPNVHSDHQRKSDVLRADEELLIPDIYYGFVFEAVEPAGDGAIYAVVTPDAIALDSLTAANRDLEIVADGEAYLDALAHRLHQIIREEDGSGRSVAWALAKLDYRIE